MYNKVIIVGVISNNGKYEIGEKSKKAVFRTNIISNTTYKTENQIKTDSCMFNLQFWGDLAESASKILAKGSTVIIEGRFLEFNKSDDNEKTKIKNYTVKVDSYKAISLNDNINL